MDPNNPWFRGPKDVQPFSLFTVLTSQDKKEFHSLACFPWSEHSLDSLWGGQVQDPELVSGWKDTARQWTGAVAVGGTGRLCIFRKLATERPIQVPLSEPDAEISNVAWAINSLEPLKPLVIITVTSVILIFDVTTRSFVGRLRGHGGPITSLSVHPIQPVIFCTTARDFTTRIYDLSLPPVQEPNNPHWLPSTQPSLAGPAHGLHMCEPEGDGTGRCVAVMVGGRSGGHRGAVLCSAFHPSQPLIATGGMDRAVKIWRIPPSVFSPSERPVLAREDKPLFSTDLVHKARVLSIHWLSDDILASCGAPAYMRRNPTEPENTYYEEGTVAVWQWLGFNRFFPPDKIPQKVMRGTASDWRNSESFKVLSAYHLPLVASYFDVFGSYKHDPILMIPVGKTVRLFNISTFGPRAPPVFPLVANGMRLDDDAQDSALRPQDQPRDAQVGDRDAEREEQEAGDERGSVPTTTYPLPAPLATLFDSVEGWEAVAQVPFAHGSAAEIPDITACAMGFEGLGLVGVGKQGTLYIWRLRR